MNLLGTLLAGLFSSLFSVFGKYFVMEKAFKLASVTAMVVLIVALFSVLQVCSTGFIATALASISAAHQNFAVGLSLGFNTITYGAASAYIVVWSACQLYAVKKRMMSALS